MRLHRTVFAPSEPDQRTAPAIVLILCSTLVALAVTGCSALPTLTKPTVSHPVDPVPNPDFAIAQAGKPGSSQGLSHVARIESGPEAFATRVALTRFAKQSL